MNINKVYYLKISLIFVVVSSYFLGFALRENSSGGAESDFIDATWPAIKGIEQEFFFAIKNYGKFGEGSWPMFHILNVLFNPFTYSQYSFQLSITFISLINFFLFENLIRKKFKLDKIDSYLFSSIILLLPFFRSSAFWGLTENFGWMFLLLAIKFYLNLEVLLTKKSINFDVIFNIFMVCLFSSLALYTRQYLIFFPIFVFLKFLLIDKNIKIFILISIIYFIFSLPGIFLIYSWGGLYDSINVPAGNVLVNHHPKYILKNIPFFFSFFTFYLMPVFLIECLSFGIKTVSKKYYLSFLVSFSIMLLLYFFNFFEYLKNVNMGGGIFLKLDYIFFNKKLIFFIICSSFGFSLLYELIKKNFKVNLLLTLSILIFCFPKFIFQEYYEPLILILFFLLYNHNIDYFFNKKNNMSIFLSLFYFTSYFIGAIYYKYFLFLSYSDWKMFIEN